MLAKSAEEVYQSQFHVFMLESNDPMVLLDTIGHPPQPPAADIPQLVESLTPQSELTHSKPAGETQSLWYQSLPSFVMPPTPNLTVDDLIFIRSKGALTIPDIELQDALIRAYFEHVHPLLPLVNVEDFIESITEGNESKSQISLLFLQAVMFAGSTYVEIDFLKSAGFASRKEARKAYYQKVRILYDFDCESDSLAIIQALLLMTFWYDGVDNNKDMWYWMDVAVGQAFAHSLNVDSRLSTSNMSLSVHRLRRRVWWSCFIRDRLTSFGMKRPPRIRDEHHNVPMLEPADFRSEHLPVRNHERTNRVCSYFGDEDRRTTLARLCIAQTNLCKCLKPGPASFSQARVESLSESPLTSLSPPVSDRTFAACQRDLLEWYDTLCHGDKYQPILANEIRTDGSANLELNRSVLHMIYYAGVLGLHRSRVYNSGVSTGEQELSKTFIQHSAKRISEITSNIEQLGLDRFLPMTAMSTTISAISVHLREIRGDFSADIFSAQENYQRCTRVLQSMKEIHCAAGLAKLATEFAVLDPSQDGATAFNLASNLLDETVAWTGRLDFPSTDDQLMVPDQIGTPILMQGSSGMSPFEPYFGNLCGENV
ncbi:hypothetical protein ACHAP5_003105 [Fusarium lateritium]